MLFLTLHCVVAVVIVLQNDASAEEEDLVCSDACKCDSEECSNRELYTSDTESDED